MYYHATLVIILAFGFSLSPARTRFLLVQLKDELQGTHYGHLSEGKPIVDELLSREFQCNFNDDCEEKFPATPICNNGVCIERTTIPEQEEGPIIESMDNPNRRCETDEDCLLGYKCKKVYDDNGLNSGGYRINKCEEDHSENGCQWFGTAPICDGECPQGWTHGGRSSRGDGSECMTGSKVYCCNK